MTTATLHFYGIRKGARPFTAGWVGVALFGALDVVAQGTKDLPYAVVLAGVAAAICGWYRMTTGRAAVVVGAVLGMFFGLGQVAYLISDLGPGDNSFWKTTFLDAIGLVAAVLILVGGLSGLLSRRRTAP